MNNAEDIAKLADVTGGMGHSGLEALKSELLARFSGAAPGGPVQFAYSAAPQERAARRRISPYESKGVHESSFAQTNGTSDRSSTFAPFFSHLPSELMGGRVDRGKTLLVDVRLNDEDDESSFDGSPLQKAMSEYEASQRHSASLGVTSALVQTALSSFKRLTQGQ